MAQTKRTHLSDDELIERYIDPDWDRYAHGRADASLKGYGVRVWALVAQLRAIGGDLDELARDYELPREAVDAAMAFYRRNRKYIDARILLTTGD
jgi:uncharacterized protein (DUF433 family)